MLDVDLSAYSDTLMLDSIEYHLFPNMFFFPGVMVPMVYRFSTRLAVRGQSVLLLTRQIVVLYCQHRVALSAVLHA